MDLDGVRLVRFLYGDPSGVVRGKQVHVARLPDALMSGLGLTRAQNALNLLDDLVPVAGMEPVGEIRIVPDQSTFTRLPWLDGVASLLCDQVDHDGADWGGCPRAFLRRAVNALAAEGLRVEAAFENEFYLAQDSPEGPRPWGDGPVYSSAGLDRAAAVMNDIVGALDAQGIQVEQAINEYGPGQQEISITRADALAAADRQLLLRDTVRGVAETRHGCSPRSRRSPTPSTSAAAATCTSRCGNRTATPCHPRASRSGSRTRPWRSWLACSSTSRRCSPSPARLTCPTPGCCPAPGRARRSRGASTTGRPRCGSPRRSAVGRT